MRVVAGSAKGTRLAPVPAGTRPVSDRAREGLFSSLGLRVEGARVLDLFAGTGAMGIEALSRGAASALFVDSAPGALKAVRENLRRTKLGKQATVRRQDALGAVRGGIGPFDLILLDPPYRAPGADVDAVLSEIAGQGVAEAGTTVVLTRSGKSYMPVIPVNWLLERRLSYGESAVLVFRTP
ncbi:MAG: 16S rRNA (guanine(966)-N(2))-methyltransferase RsmD [Actinomycetota bacterium]